MIFHENRLLADDSHVISYLIFVKIGKDVAKFVVCCSRDWHFERWYMTFLYPSCNNEFFHLVSHNVSATVQCSYKTLKVPITTAADDESCNIFLNFRTKIRYDISWESSDSRRFSWNIFLICYVWKSSKISNCCLLQIIGGALWVKGSQVRNCKLR